MNDFNSLSLKEKKIITNAEIKRVIIFSPHPDDDVISMGGTFDRLINQGHDVHIAYQTSGNTAVWDEFVLEIFEQNNNIAIDRAYNQVQKEHNLKRMV